MNTSLHDLGVRAGTVPVPVPDVEALVAAGESRIRRRRLVAVASVTAVVLAVLSGAALLAPATQQSAPPPAGDDRSHSTDQDVVETRTATRLLTYALGTVVHWGDRTVDVAEHVPGRRKWLGFLQPTDDGVVFVSGPPARNGGVAYDEPIPVWFTDGTTPVRIGTTSGSVVRGYFIAPSVAGSTLAWREDYHRGGVVVYDTSRMREVARFGGAQSYVLNQVYDDVVYWTPDGRSCESGDSRLGSLTWCKRGARVMRFDVASRQQTRISWAEYVADRRSRPGLLTGPDHQPRGCISCVISRDGLYHSLAFVRRGHRLVLGDDYGLDFRAVTPADEFAPTVALTGRPLRLRLPPRYEDAELWLITQWLDPDRAVLLADGEPAGVADRGKTHELLVCRLSTGDCRVAASPDQADGLFTAPGPAGIKG